MMYLKFDTQEAMLIATQTKELRDRFNESKPIIVGTLYMPTGETLKGYYQDIQLLEAIPGWHVNLGHRIEELAQWEIPEPKTPAVTWFK